MSADDPRDAAPPVSADDSASEEPDAETVADELDFADAPDAEPPDPSEVDAIGDSEGVYQRDSDGELTPDPWQVIEWGGEWHKVRYYPVPVGEVEQYRGMGEDVDMSELCDILAEKVHKPDRTADEWADTDPGQFMAVLGGLVENAVGDRPSSEFHAEVREELEARAAEGN